jgi:hypothetical protein
MAYLVYRAAVDKAVAWGDVVRMVFELHRGALAQKLELRPFKSRAEERQLWKGISGWMLWVPDKDRRNKPGTPWPSDNLFTPVPAEPAVPELSWIASDNVNVQVNPTHNSEEWRDVSIQDYGIEYVQYQHYVVGVSTKNDKHQAPILFQSAYILITYPQVKYIDPTLTLENAAEWGNPPPSGQIIPSGSSESQQKLLWQIPTIQSHSGRVLIFKTAVARRCVATTDQPGLKVVGTTKLVKGENEAFYHYRFTVTNTTEATKDDIKLMVVDHRFVLSEKIPSGTTKESQEPLTPQKVPIGDVFGYSWPLGSIEAKQEITFVYSVSHKV